MRNQIVRVLAGLFFFASCTSINAQPSDGGLASHAWNFVSSHRDSIVKTCAVVAVVCGGYMNRPSQWRRKTWGSRSSVGSSSRNSGQVTISYPPILGWLFEDGNVTVRYGSGGSIAVTSAPRGTRVTMNVNGIRFSGKIEDIKTQIESSSRSSQGSSVFLSEDRSISEDIDTVSVEGIGTLVLRQLDGDDQSESSLSVEGDDNIVPHIATETTGTSLSIHLEDGIGINPQLPLVYRLALRNIRSIRLAGTTELQADGELHSDNLTLDFSGVANGQANVQVGQLEVKCSGTSQVTLSGRADNQDVKLSGTSRYNATEITSDQAKVKVSGVSRASLAAQKFTQLTASGSAYIGYRSGQAPEAITKSGVAKIEQID